MLLLINHRYPVLGSVLAVLLAVASLAYGVATSRAVFLVMGAFSLALAVARINVRRRTKAAASRH